MAAPVKNIVDGGFYGSTGNINGFVNKTNSSIAISIPVNPHSLSFLPIVLTVDASNKQFSVLGVAPPAAQTTTLPVIYKERSINQVLSGQIHPRGDQ